MIKATVGILTFNCDKNLNECLKSVNKFNEILILDGGSSDQTLNIAKKYKCKIYKQPKKFKFNNNKIKNFSELKNLFLKLSTNDLILFLDSDEILDQSILKKIDFYSKSISSKKKYYSFLLGRYPIFKKNLIKRKTIFYPNFQERLIYKSNIKYFIKPVHERPIPKSSKLKSKIFQGLSIKFPINTESKKLFQKYNYYYKIEKEMFLKNPKLFKNLKFVIFRLFVIFKYVIRYFIFHSKKNDEIYKNFELENVKLNLYFSIKLLKNILIKIL